METDLRKVIDLPHTVYDRGGQLDEFPEIVRQLRQELSINKLKYFFHIL